MQSQLLTFAVNRLMNMVLYDYDGKIIPRTEYRLNFLAFVEETPRKNINQETGPIVARPLARWVICNDVILDHNGGFILKLI